MSLFSKVLIKKPLEGYFFIVSPEFEVTREANVRGNFKLMVDALTVYAVACTAPSKSRERYLCWTQKHRNTLAFRFNAEHESEPEAATSCSTSPKSRFRKFVQYIPKSCVK